MTEANRIKLAHYFDPYLAIHTSLVDPLPHQISAVYGEMLPRQPLRFLLADDPGAGKTIMAGLLIKELIARSDLERCLVIAPGSLVEQWQDELGEKFSLEFDILTRDMIENSRSGNAFNDRNRLIARLDVLARNEELQQKLLSSQEWDLIICDEAHRMSATYFGGDVKYTKRYQLGQALGQMCRHLLLMSAMRNTILQTKFAELTRNEERRKTQRFDLQVDTVAGLLPWREVVEPHQDVATGEFQQAEFAADLAKVHNGSAPDEYKKPREFFARTYLTEGLSALLVGAAKRLSAAGGDPVVELQTNFGGGKTHSMLALYHMVGGTPAEDLPGLDQLMRSAGLKVPEKVNRAVLVGTSNGPMDVAKRTKDYGREIRTTWGELAFQLGGEAGYALVQANDESGIAPGSNLLEQLFRECAPSLILIDEWVAYLRQIYRVEGLPSGSFDANLSFVQSLTEAVKASPGTLLVASLPASQIEVGGEGGQEALNRLKQTFSRVESPWRPATPEESYEIVRRRLFKEVPGDKFHHRDNTLKQFAKLYRENSNDFPQGCADEDYRRKLEKAYPIHPELYDQLYTSWGSLEKFQRTRGVLRLMAQVVHELWMGGDPSVMIMPGSVAISSPRVEPELLHYLEPNWQAIIGGDVDGVLSTPYKVDRSAPNLAKVSATVRVARTVFMGTAPMHGQNNKGLDDKQINLGVVQPGERPAIFGDGMTTRRLPASDCSAPSSWKRCWAYSGFLGRNGPLAAPSRSSFSMDHSPGSMLSSQTLSDLGAPW